MGVVCEKQVAGIGAFGQSNFEDLLGKGGGGRVVACEEDGGPGSGAQAKELRKVAEPFREHPCTRPKLHRLRRGIALGHLEHAHERAAKVQFIPVARLRRRQPIEQRAGLTIGLLRFLERAPRKRRLPRILPGGDGWLGFGCFSPMPGQQHRLRRSRRRKLLTYRARNAGMELAAFGLEQAFVGSVADQCMLELVGRSGRPALRVNQIRPDECVERGLYVLVRARHDRP